MLGKLFKYEFKGSAKIMLTIYAVLTAVTILGSIVLSTDIIQNSTGTAASLLTFSLVLLYVISVFALFIVTYVYMCVRFFKTMYSDQGYLTHTLPVSPLTTLNVKLLTSLVWMSASFLLLLASILILLTGVTHGEFWIELTSSDFNAINTEFKSLFDITFGQFIAWMCFSVLVSCFSYLLLVFTSTSVGQLFHQYKIAASIVAGIIFYFLQQIIGTAVLLIAGNSMWSGSGIVTDGNGNLENAQLLKNTFLPFFASGLGLELAFIVIYYITCAVIVKRHINLD